MVLGLYFQLTTESECRHKNCIALDPKVVLIPNECPVNLSNRVKELNEEKIVNVDSRI